MTDRDPFEKAFHETLVALGQENLNNLVVVGGWCPYLYSQYVWKKSVPFPRTMDIDFAVKNMSPDRFSEPVYKKLEKANLIPKKIDMDDNNRTQFNYVDGNLVVPIEFVTAPNVLPKGQASHKVPYVACDPVDEVAFALKFPSIKQQIIYKDQKLDIQITNPAAFVVVKGLLIEHRTDSKKIDKDLASIAFVLRYAPYPARIISDIRAFRKDDSVIEFKNIIDNLFKSPQGEGYLLLKHTYQNWGVPVPQINEEIKANFRNLLALSLEKTVDRDAGLSL